MQNWLRSLGVYVLYIILLISFSDILYYVSFHSSANGSISHLILSPSEYSDQGANSMQASFSSRAYVQPFNVVALIIFILAIFHIFSCHAITALSNKLRLHNVEKGLANPDTFSVEILRFLGEVELVFGLWVIPLAAMMAVYYDWKTAIYYLEGRDYTEPLFVIVIMLIAQTRPIIEFAENCLRLLAKIGGGHVRAWWWSILTVGPLFGSLITEPAAMTISALLIGKHFYRLGPSRPLAYATLGLLFTNISVGGVLTNFAAPPVLMVKKAWGWSSYFMLVNFGWKALLGILVANGVYFFTFRREFRRLEREEISLQKVEEKHLNESPLTPFWMTLVHLFFLVWIVVHAHYPVIFIGSFLLFLGFYQATLPYQDQLLLRTSILVGFFLAGLVVHGTLQAWWISLLLENASNEALQVMAVLLTAINDNAEITFLASLIPSFTDAMRYAVVAGAVTGGGLTVIANAPNLPGQSLLRRYFKEGITVPGLFIGALVPMLILGFVFYLL